MVRAYREYREPGRPASFSPANLDPEMITNQTFNYPPKFNIIAPESHGGWKTRPFRFWVKRPIFKGELLNFGRVLGLINHWFPLRRPSFKPLFLGGGTWPWPGWGKIGGPGKPAILS